LGISGDEEETVILNTIKLPSSEEYTIRKAKNLDAEELSKNILTEQPIQTTLENIKIIRKNKGWLQVVGQVGDEIVRHILAIRQSIHPDNMCSHHVQLSEIVITKKWRNSKFSFSTSSFIKMEYSFKLSFKKG